MILEENSPSSPSPTDVEDNKKYRLRNDKSQNP